MRQRDRVGAAQALAHVRKLAAAGASWVKICAGGGVVPGPDDDTAVEVAPETLAAIVAEAETRGLILLSCGTRANVVRLLPPLTIPFEILEEGLGILEASIEGAITKTAAAA